jgi:xanthine/uracil permease
MPVIIVAHQAVQGQTAPAAVLGTLALVMVGVIAAMTIRMWFVWHRD